MDLKKLKDIGSFFIRELCPLSLRYLFYHLVFFYKDLKNLIFSHVFHPPTLTLNTDSISTPLRIYILVMELFITYYFLFLEQWRKTKYILAFRRFFLAIEHSTVLAYTTYLNILIKLPSGIFRNKNGFYARNFSSLLFEVFF